ncbi:hypothetical protein NEOLI_005219, partial [Neolecta irregularis DAH-3]
VVVVAPPGRPELPADYLADWGPDAFHIAAYAPAARHILPPVRLLPSAYPQNDPAARHVYETTLTVHQPGTYALNGELEYSNWDWLLAAKDEVQAYTMLRKAVNTLGVPSFTVAGKAPALPACGSHSDMFHGYWKRVDHVTHPFPDDWSFTWQPYSCDLVVTDLQKCLQHKNIQVLGDSNTRRHIKLLVTNDKWAADPNSDLQCEDDHSAEPQSFDIHWPDYLNTCMAKEPLVFGLDTSIYMEFIGRLDLGVFCHWRPLLYDHDPPDSYSKDAQIHGSPRPIPGRPLPDILFVSIGAWDVAFSRNISEFTENVEAFHYALTAAYPSSKFIIRLAYTLCCTLEKIGDRRISSHRVKLYNDITKRVFKAKNVWFLDPFEMGGREELLTDYKPCWTNHARVSHMRLENQVMGNMLCGKSFIR